MKNLHLILVFCFITASSIGQNIYQNNSAKNRTQHLNSLNITELFDMFMEIKHNEILFPKKVTSSKTNNNKQGVYEFITQTKDYRTGAIVNSAKAIFRYNSQGDVFQENYYSWDNNTWKDGYKVEYAVSSGRVSTMITYWFENSIWHKNVKTTYNYDSNGNLILETSQYQHNEVWTNKSKINYTYNNHNNLDYYISSNWTAVTSTWWQSKKSEYIYNNSKKDTNSDDLISFINLYSYSSNTWNNTNRYAYLYNEFNKITSISYERWVAAKTLGWNTDSKTEYVYNENNKLAEYTDYYAVSGTLKQFYKTNYTYDENINVNLSTEFKYKNEAWVNNNRVTNLVYDTNYSTDDLLTKHVFDNMVELEYMLLSWDNEEWSNNTWNKDGGVSVTYQEINILNLYTSNIFPMKIYPNPSEGLISIEYSKTMNNPTFEIYNTSGKVMKMKNIESNDQIDISDLKSGIYG